MTGIQFLIDSKGRRTAVLIDLKKHQNLWEDFEDALVAQARENEKTTSYAEYRAKRKRQPVERG